jgi:predicted ribosomally synthesized peptide with nif11-like leader
MEVFMSKESAKLLIEKLKNDEEFRNRILAEEDLDERLKLIKDSGFDCTVEEIEAEQAELSDDELDNVSGGFQLPCFFHFYRCGNREIGRP